MTKMCQYAIHTFHNVDKNSSVRFCFCNAVVGLYIYVASSLLRLFTGYTTIALFFSSSWRTAFFWISRLFDWTLTIDCFVFVFFFVCGLLLSTHILILKYTMTSSERLTIEQRLVSVIGDAKRESATVCVSEWEATGKWVEQAFDRDHHTENCIHYARMERARASERTNEQSSINDICIVIIIIQFESTSFFSAFSWFDCVVAVAIFFLFWVCVVYFVYLCSHCKWTLRF